MRCTDGVEARLIEALLGGVYEDPLWSSFLSLLRGTTVADHALMMFQPPNRPFPDFLVLLDGSNSVSEFTRSYLEHFSPAETPVGSTIPEGVPVSLQDIFEFEGERNARRPREFARLHGVTAGRQMIVREDSGITAWLSIARKGEDFSSEVDALLKRLVPVLRGVLRLYVSIERARYSAAISQEATRRLSFGWVALDAAGSILEADEQAESVLASSDVLSRSPTGRLMSRSSEVMKEIARALASFASDARSRPRALSLSREPWLDMLLMPASRTSLVTRGPATAIAYIHGDSWDASDRAQLLAELFGLLPREAKLAFALSRGITLTEAADHFGWTIATARTYSKSVYAKTGVRGQPDLVRLIMRSVLAFRLEA